MTSILIDKIYKHNFHKFNDLIMFLLLRTFNQIIISFPPIMIYIHLYFANTQIRNSQTEYDYDFH